MRQIRQCEIWGPHGAAAKEATLRAMETASRARRLEPPGTASCRPHSALCTSPSDTPELAVSQLRKAKPLTVPFCILHAGTKFYTRRHKMTPQNAWIFKDGDDHDDLEEADGVETLVTSQTARCSHHFTHQHMRVKWDRRQT